MLTRPAPVAAVQPLATTRATAVVVPVPNNFDWDLFQEIPEEIPIIVVDDSDGTIDRTSRKNVRFFDYAAQRAVMGDHYPAIPHKAAATRNFGHYLAYREGFDVIFALDYDCRPGAGWLHDHLAQLDTVQDALALAGEWINSIEAPGFYARGFPYEYRNKEAGRVTETLVSGEVKLNMGVWRNVLDLNGIDKIHRDVPAEPGLRGPHNYVALGNIPVCGMNVAFRAELTPAYYFLPDVWIDGWQLSRHDDIWGGYILKKLMDRRGDLFSYGRPIVDHTKQSDLNRVMVIEHYMHLMAREFYEIVDQAAERVLADGYAAMFAHFTEEYQRGVERCRAPRHYQQVYRELGQAMARWSACFR